MRRLALMLLLLLGALPARAAGPVELRASLDRTRTDLGRSLRLEIDLEARQGVKVEPPAADTLQFPPFEVRDAALTPLAPGDGVRRWRYTVLLAAARPGRLEVPPFEVAWRSGDRDGVARTAALAVEVASAPPEPRGEIRDLKGPVAASVAPLYGAAALLALLGAAVLLLAGRLARGLARPASPHSRALAELDRLERDPGLPPEQVVARAADVLRAWLATRYGLPATVRTTGEVARELARSEGFPADLAPSVEEVLAEADLAKFARARPEATAARERVGAVRTLVERMRPGR